MKTTARTCPLCEATCGLQIQSDGDRVLSVRGDPDDVWSQGYLCPKGSTLGELHHDPDRLRRPLIKRDGEFQETTWEDAYRTIQGRLAPLLARPNRDVVGVYLGNPNVHNLAGNLYPRPFLKALGSKNLFTASTVDQMPREVACGLLYGNPDAVPVPDIDRSSYLLMLGANPMESNGSLWTAPNLPGRLRALRERGGRLVVVDPRRTRSAERADLHLPIRPGSDAAWLLAIAHVLEAEDRIAPGRLRAWLDGEGKAREWVRAFSPERVADFCGIDAATTRRIARELAEAERAAVYSRIGVQAGRFGTLAAWACDLLNIWTGNLDREGGVMFPRAVHSRVRSGKPGGRGFKMGRWHSRVREAPEVRNEFPVSLLAEEIETPGDGQIRALITVAGNPVLSTPDGRRLSRALQGLELMISVDPYLNETTRHADVILPPPSALERSHYDLTFYGAAIRKVAKYSPAVFEATGPSEASILSRLALIIGGHPNGDEAQIDRDLLFPQIEREVSRDASPVAGRDPEALYATCEGDDGCERIVDFLLRSGPFGDGFGVDPEGLTLARLKATPSGIDYGPMTSELPGLLDTPSGKIDLARDELLPEFPRLSAAIDARREAGFTLIGRRHLRSNNSWMHNLPSLMTGRDRCTLWMHPRDADQAGLADGAAVEVESTVGKVVVSLEVTDAVMEGVVSLPHGYGHAEAPGLRVATEYAGVSANDLVTGEIDPISGNAVLNGVAVRVGASA